MAEGHWCPAAHLPPELVHRLAQDLAAVVGGQQAIQGAECLLRLCCKGWHDALPLGEDINVRYVVVGAPVRRWLWAPAGRARCSSSCR